MVLCKPVLTPGKNTFDKSGKIRKRKMNRECDYTGGEAGNLISRNIISSM